MQGDEAVRRAPVLPSGQMLLFALLFEEMKRKKKKF